MIIAPDSATTFADINGTANAFKNTTDRFSIEVMETTTNQAEPTTTGAVSSATNMDAGFESKEYGTNLTLGTWYFEESDGSSTSDQVDANFHIETRQFKFKPNATNIRNLSAGSVRYSTITIATTSGSNTTNMETMTIAIYRAELPNFTISVVNSSINEGDSARFKITADKDPGTSPITISITPTNTAGNYLEESNDSNGNSRMSGDSRSVPVTFTQTPGQNEWTSTFDIAMRNIDNKDADHGLVTVVLDPITGSITSATYTTTPDNSASVQIVDQDVPKISIAPAANIVANQNAEFTLTTDIEPWQPLAVRYIPTETGSNYLDTTNGISGAERITYPPITFTLAGAGPMATGILTLPTITDANVSSGSINIQLVEDPSSTPKNYQLTDTIADRMASVQIATAPTPELSIMGSSTAVNEGEPATIVVTASEDPKVPVTISYTPTETESNFLDPFNGASGESRTTTLNFSDDGNGNWTANFTLATRPANGVDESQGEIVVVLDSPVASAHYTIASSPNDQITIVVNDINAPTIVIDNASATIMGDNVLFPVTASIQPWQNVELRYTAVSTGGSFLTPINNEANSIRTAEVTFYSQGPNLSNIGTLVVPTAVDPDADSGTITITLMDDNTNPANYEISESTNEQEGVVNILDIPGPTLKITSVTSSIIEGREAKFIVTANTQPKSAINVNYTPSNVSGSYLDSTMNPTGVEKTSSLSFYQRFGSDDWTAELIVYTRNTDRTSQAGGVISVLLNPADDISNYVVASEPNHFSTILIQDTDTPIISINSAPDTIIGQTAEFTLVADIQPIQALEITYIVSEIKGNFLDETNYSSGQEVSGRFKFSPVAGQGIIATLLVDTVPDQNLKEGTISVTIFNDIINSPKHYQLPSNATNISANVNLISKPIPTLSFDSTQPTAKEGTDSYVTLIANKNPKRELTISYTLFDSINNTYLDTAIPDPNTTVLNQDGSITKTETVTFSQQSGSSTWTANLPVPIRAKDDSNTFTGEIRAVLDQPAGDAGYEIANTLAKSTAITVNDANIPVISIHRVNTAIAGYGMKVILSADIGTTEPIAINYKPIAQRTDSWLDETDGALGETRTTAPLTFASTNTGRYEASFTILTQRGPQQLTPQGIIAVQLLPDTNNPIKYEPTLLVDQNGNNVYQSVSAVVYPGTAPEFSLNAGITTMNQNRIDFSEKSETNNLPFQEGDTVKLHIAASSANFPDIALIPSLNLSYTIENLTGNFINLAGGATTETRTTKLEIERLSLSTYGNYIDLPLRPRDNLDSLQGKIKITLNAGSNYGVTSNNEVTILVNDHEQDSPVISIVDAPEISPTNSAQFTLVSNIQPWGPVSISFIATNSPETNFLGTTSPTQSVTFSQLTSDHLITGILTIPTILDLYNPEGTITVTILENNTTPSNNLVSHDYTLSTNTSDQTATVQIKASASTKPTLSIRPSDKKANEGGTAKFVITASKNPGPTPLTVKWSRVEEVGSFLDTSIAMQAQPTSSHPWAFTQSSPSEPWIHELTLQLKTPANNTDEVHGKIKVTLESPIQNANYLIADSPLDTATKTIFDQSIPVISIANASETLAGNEARFTLTTNQQPHSPISIKFTAENLATGGNFLDTTGGESGATRISENLTFTPTQNPNEFASTLLIPTTDDLEATAGTIKIVLIDDDDPKDYQITDNNDEKTAEVNVIDVPLPELTLANANPTSTDEDSPAMVVVSTDQDPKQSLSIKYTPTTIKGNYLVTANGDSGRARTTAPLTFSLDSISGKYTAIFPVAINSDTVDADHGEILIVLDEPDASANYTVAPTPNNQLKVIVFDDETPLITIENNPQSIVAGNMAEFTLTSDLKPWQDIAIRFIPTNELNANFLDTSGGLGDSNSIRTTTPLNFKQSGADFTAKFKVPTVDDPTMTSGKISIVLRPDTTTPQKPRVNYRISVRNSEKVTDVTVVNPSNTPTISIIDIDTAINEGETMVFHITATADPQRPLDIKYTPENNLGGNFLDTTDGDSGSTRTKRVNFTESRPGVWTATIEVPTNAPNGIDDADGSIKVTLNDAVASDGYIRHSTNNMAMVAVKDADAPIITIENATETLAGNEAKFKLTSNIRPQGDELTIYYTPTNTTGEFLNSTAQMQTVPFSSAGNNEPYTGDLSISTQDDANLTAGSISIDLQDDTINTPKKYTLSPISRLRSAIGNIIDVPNPTLSISAKYDAMLEGEMLNFIVTASKNPKQMLMVKYTPTEDTPLGDRHFDSTHATYPHTTQISTTQELEFRQLHINAPWSSEIHIPVRNVDGKDADNSNISVTLDPPNAGAGYRVADSPNNTISTKILDAETPIITITNALLTLAGNMAKFTLTSDIEPWQDLDIKFIPRETIGNFLDTTNNDAGNEWTASNLEFTRSDSTQPWTAILMIPTTDDLNNEIGEITITLVDDAGSEDYEKSYTINTDAVPSTSPTEYFHTATVAVIDTSIPALSIDEITDPVIEGNDITFVVRANKNPIRPLKVWYKPENVTQSFLDTTDGISGAKRVTDRLTFRKEQGNDDWSAEFTVATNGNELDNPHGSIKITLVLPNDSDPEFADAYTISSVLGEDNSTATIRDDDIPQISITRAIQNEILGGRADATFTLKSHIEPHNTIIISYTPTNGPIGSPGNFLDPTDPVSNTTKESGEPRLSESLTFSSPPELDPPVYTATLTVPTQDDRINTTGEIKVELVDDTGDKDYTLSTTLSTSATISIVQTPYPLLTIASNVSTIDEGESASFTIMANQDPKRDLIVNYTPENNIGGDFLKVDAQSLKPSGEIRTIKIKKAMFVPEPALNPTMWTANITIPTRPTNGKDEDHGSLKVTLNDAPVENPYMIDKSSDKNDASVRVLDIDVPQISIASTNENEILGGLDDATFTLTSHIEPRAEIVVSYTPTNGPVSSPGNFLDPTDPVSNTTKMSGETRMSESLEFTDTDSDSVFTATLTIPTLDDRINESGEIKVQLSDDAGDDKDYILSTTRPTSDKVSIIQVPHPFLTIFYNGTTITEGETATFTINASKEPKRDLSINYTPENNTGGDYLKVDSEDLKSSGIMRTVTIANNMFTPEPTLNPTLWTAEITIPTRIANNKDENHGSITVTLNDSPTNNPYIINNTSDDNHAEVKVNDFDAPEVTISNAAETFAGNEIMFTLTASIEPLNDLEIQFIPTEATDPATGSVTNFLNPNDPVSETTKESGVSRTSAELEFTRTGEGQPYTAILKLPTQLDPNADSGTILVELQNDSANTPPTYTITSDPSKIAQNTATASVVEKVNPVLSIAYNGNAIREGQTATFTIITDEDPKRDLTFNFTPENNTDGDFLKVDTQDLKPSGEKRSDTISKGAFTLIQGQSPPMWSAEFTIETRGPNGEDEDHGSITVTLEDPDSAVSDDYSISSNQGKNSAMVTVYDLEEPKISILPAEETFGGEDAEFALEAHIQPWKPLTVRFSPSNNSADFLDDHDDSDDATGYTSGDTYSQIITFSEDPISKKIFGTLPIPTKVDQNNADGAITVTIYDDESVLKNYTLVDDTSKHSAQVNVNNYPKLSIEYAQSAVNEGAPTADFIVTATYDPGEKLSVNYTVTESSSNFRHSSVKTESQTSIDLTFAQNSLPTNTDWTAKIPIQLRGDDNIDSTDGEFKVTLEPVSANATAKYIVASQPSNSSTVTIRDVDIPTFSISNASDTFNGETANFMVNSDIKTEQTHTLMVKATNSEGSNFLDTSKFENAKFQLINDVNFMRISTSNFIYILEIPTIIDTDSTTGNISVELATNTTNTLARNSNESDTYNIDPNNKTATVAVYRTVTFSVSPPNSKVYEGDELNFTLTSNHDPRPLAPLDIVYSVSQEGNYLGSSVDSLNTISLKNLIFERDTATRNWITTIPIPLRNQDQIDSSSGTVTIELQQADPDTPKYQVDISSATATIHNVPIPIISISNASEITAGENAEFTITSNVEVDRAISILIKPTNTNGEFLNIDVGASNAVRTINNVIFTRSAPDQPFTYTLIIPTIVDEDSALGLIKVELVADTQQQNSYTISKNSTNQIASVVVLRAGESRTLRITDATIQEGVRGTTTDLEFNVNLIGGTLTFPITVNYAVNDYVGPLTAATRGTDFNLEDGSIVIPAGVSTTPVPITVSIIGDNHFERDEGFNITISIITGPKIEIVKSNAVGTIMNNDSQFAGGIPEIEIDSDQQSIMKGGHATFTITADRPIGHTAPINVQIQIAGKELLYWRAPRQVAILANEDYYELKISTKKDTNSEPEEGTITVTIEDIEENYTINPDKQSASVRVQNDTINPQTSNLPRISVAESAVISILHELDLATSPIESVESADRELAIISVVALNQNISEGEAVEFDIFSTGQINDDLLISFAINQNGDFLTAQVPEQVKILKSSSKARVVINTQNDQIAEADGTITLQLQQLDSYNISSQNSATITVSDAVDRQIRQDLIMAGSQAFLPDVVGNMTARTSDIISQRIEQGFSEAGNTTFNLSGNESIEGLIEMSGEMTNQGSVSWRELLGDSSFALTLLSGDDFIAPTSIWGVGDYRNLSSSSSSQSWSGDIFTGQFGIDTLIGQEILAGLSASISENDIEFDSENAENLEFALNSTTLTPYLGWTSPNQNAELRAIASYGIGEFFIDQANYDLENLASRSYSLAFSGRKELYSSNSILNGTTKLNVVGDSWFARNYIDGKDEVSADLQTNAHYLRIRTEGTHQFSFARGTTLSPLISVGIRDDRKDQLTNFGMELNSGFDFTDPIGLTLSGTGSLLFAGENSIQKMSITGSLGYDYGNDALGLTFGISPTWGKTQISVQNTLWSSSILASDQEVGQYSDGTQVSSEIGYGFTLGEELRKLNLYSGYEFDAQANDKLSLGTSLTIGPNLSLDLERKSTINTPRSEVTKYQFNALLSW